MPSAQRDEVREIGLAAQHPRHHVMHLGEVGEPTARESAALVSAVDLNTLSPRRTSSCSFLVENRSVLSFEREDHLGIASQTTSYFARDRPHSSQLGHAIRIFARQEVQICMHNQGGTKSRRHPNTGAQLRAGICIAAGPDIDTAQIHKRVVEPLIKRYVADRFTAHSPGAARVCHARRRRRPTTLERSWRPWLGRNRPW